MPINELEEHPYLNYYKEFGQVPTDYYKGIIIGSFPIYAITNTVNEQNEILDKRFNDDAFMRFFYGSKKSELWEYLIKALESEDLSNGSDINESGCASLLFKNKLLMSDVLFRTNRRINSANDKDLMVNSEADWVNNRLCINTQLISLLLENKGINNIYFTSTIISTKGPFYWFKQIFKQQLKTSEFYSIKNRTWSSSATIDFTNGIIRSFNLFFLPTPKARGMHWGKTRRTAMFENYIASHFPNFYKEINLLTKARFSSAQQQYLSVLRTTMLIKAYEQAIVYCNTRFDGSNFITKMNNG